MIEHVHKRTVRSMSLATVAGAAVGSLTVAYGPIGAVARLVIAAVLGKVAFWYLPSSEHIATVWEYRERQ